MRTHVIATLALVLLAAAAPARAQIPGGIKLPTKLPGGGALPGGSCNKLSGDAGLRLEGFLAATAALEKATAELEGSVKTACQSMARELGVSESGNTKAVCTRALASMKAGLRLSAKAKSKTVVNYTPAKCELRAEASAKVAAACNGSAAGSAGTGGSAGSMAGGCKANADARASLEAQCTPAKVEVSSDTSLALDAGGYQRASKALMVGLPALLMAGARAKLAAAAVKTWAGSARAVVKSSGSLAKDFGVQALCVAGRIKGAMVAVPRIEASVSVSVSVSASASGAAGVN